MTTPAPSICDPAVTMNSRLLFAFLVFAMPAWAADADLKGLLQKGLIAEEADGDLAAASTAYEELIRTADAQRKLIATAVFRLAEVKRKQGHDDEAAALYQRVVAEFGSQEALVKLARENLSALGRSVPAATATATADGPEAAEIARMETLLRESPDRARREYPLHLAAKKGWPLLASAMLNRGFDVNGLIGEIDDGSELKIFSNYSPLSIAALEGNKKVAELLIAAGANVDGMLTESGAESFDGPLWTAISNGRPEMVKLLIPLSRKPPWRSSIFAGKSEWTGTALACAVKSGKEEFLSLLLANGYDANERLQRLTEKEEVDPASFLPLLSYAVSVGNPPILEALLAAGADVNAVGSDGTTPLFACTGSSAAANAAVLIKHGADVNVRGPNGMTPFLTHMDQPEVLKLLLAAGADPKVTDQKGNTALHLCAQRGIKDREVFKLLLSLPIDPVQKNQAGSTAFQDAVASIRNLGRGVEFDIYLAARTLFKEQGVWAYLRPDGNDRNQSEDELVSQVYLRLADSEPLPTLGEFLPLCPTGQGTYDQVSFDVLHRLDSAKPADLVTKFKGIRGDEEALFQALKPGDALSWWGNYSTAALDTLLQKLAMRITVSFSGIERTFAIRTLDPWHPESPQLGYGKWRDVLNFLPGDKTKVKLVRVIDGQKIEHTMNLTSDRPSTWPRVMNGDRIELASLPADPESVTLLMPDIGFSAMARVNEQIGIHLCELLNVGPPLGRDWSRVLIWRKGKDQPETVDLAKAAEENSDPSEVPRIFPGDRVELGPDKQAPLKPVGNILTDYLRKFAPAPLSRRRMNLPQVGGD